MVGTVGSEGKGRGMVVDIAVDMVKDMYIDLLVLFPTLLVYGRMPCLWQGMVRRLRKNQGLRRLPGLRLFCPDAELCFGERRRRKE